MKDIREGMECPVCESGNLKEEIKDLDFEYKDNEFIVKNQKVLVCPKCDKIYYTPKEKRKLERILTDQKRIADGLLTSREIKEIRKKFDMTQEEFAEIFQVGKKNFARYENGQSIQSRSMDHLLRILNIYPYTMRIVNPNWDR